MRRLLTALAIVALLAGGPDLAAAQPSIETGSLDIDIDAQQAALVLRLHRFRFQLIAEDYLSIAVDEAFDGIRIDPEAPLALDLARRDAELDGEQRVLLTISVRW